MRNCRLKISDCRLKHQSIRLSRERFNLKSTILDLQFDSRGLLLGHAVHRAQSPNEVSRVDGDDFAGGEELRERV